MNITSTFKGNTIPEVTIMVKNGISYIKQSYRIFFDKPLITTKINGKIVTEENFTVCKGNGTYYQYNGVVETIEIKQNDTTKYSKYELKDEYKDLLSSKYPLETFYGELFDVGGYVNRDVAEKVYPGIAPIFYNLRTEVIPGGWKDVDFVVIDRDCEPLIMLSGVKIEFPHYLSEYPDTWHKYPCYLPYDLVYNIVHDRIEKIVSESNGKYSIDNYKNIQTLTVQERIKLSKPSKVTKSYYPTLRSKKMKDREVEVYYKRVVVLKLLGNYDQKETQTPRTINVKGNNYVELLENLESYIQSFTDQLTKPTRCVCPTCHGEGTILEK